MRAPERIWFAARPGDDLIMWAHAIPHEAAVEYVRADLHERVVRGLVRHNNRAAALAVEAERLREALARIELGSMKVTGQMVDAALLAASSGDDHGHTDCFYRVVLQAALDAYDPGDGPLPPCDYEDPAPGATENAETRQEEETDGR